MRSLLRAPALRAALAVSWLLVIARSLVFVVYEHAHFDSDQAIVGLMAKHLSEGRAFPLFFYGQSYMLGVEAWWAVPFFWVAGATVAALRASIVATNLAVVTLLIVGLHRCGLRPFHALVPALFLVFPAPDTAAFLVEAQGGNIEPFLWILMLWFVRERPFWLGSLLAIGFLNREFVLYAVPVLLAGQAWSGTLFTRSRVRAWLFALVAFLAVWQGIRALEPLSDVMGPGTRGAAAMAARGSQIENLSQRLQVDVRGLPARVWAITTRDVAGLLGGRSMVDGVAPQGRGWFGYVLAIALLAAIGRIGILAARSRATLHAMSFGWYVLGVGVVAVLAYSATRPAEDVVRRYLLLSLLMPVGLSAVWLMLEPRRLVRAGVMTFVLGWAFLAGIDNWRQFDRYASSQVPNPMRELVTALEARGITVAEAPYWRAYKLAFLSQERIMVASSDVVRITEYQRRADAAGDQVVRIREEPCAGGTQVGGWFLCEVTR